MESQPRIERQPASHEVLEKEIQELRKEVESYRARVPDERAAVHRVVGERVQQEKRMAGVHPSAIVPHYITLNHPELRLQVEQLIDRAWHQGLSHTLKEARKSGMIILDAFHDALTDKLYDEFQKRGLFKPRIGKLLTSALILVVSMILLGILL